MTINIFVLKDLNGKIIEVRFFFFVGYIVSTVVPTKSDSDVIFCLQLLSKILTCTLRIGFINK